MGRLRNFLIGSSETVSHRVPTTICHTATRPCWVWQLDSERDSRLRRHGQTLAEVWRGFIASTSCPTAILRCLPPSRF